MFTQIKTSLTAHDELLETPYDSFPLFLPIAPMYMSDFLWKSFKQVNNCLIEVKKNVFLEMLINLLQNAHFQNYH